MDLYVTVSTINCQVDVVSVNYSFENALETILELFCSAAKDEFKNALISYDISSRKICIKDDELIEGEDWFCYIDPDIEDFHAGICFDEHKEFRIFKFHSLYSKQDANFDIFLNKKIHEVTEKYKTISNKKDISLLEELRISLAVFQYMKNKSSCLKVTNKTNTFLNNIGKDFLAEAKRFYLFNDEFNELPESVVHDIVCECIEKAKQSIIDNIKNRLFSKSERSEIYHDKEGRPYRVCWRRHRKESC